MIPSTPVVVVGLVALAIALPAVVSRRRDALPVRCAGLLALVAVWFAAGDWPVAVREWVPGELRVVATGGGEGAWADRLRAVDPDAVVAIDAVGAADPGAAWLAAALRASATTELALVWDGTFAPAATLPFVRRGAQLFSSAPAPVVEPDDLSLRLVSELTVGRPAAVELEIARAARGELPPDAIARVFAVDAAGATLFEHTLSAVELAVGPQRVGWTPAVAAPCAVRIELRAGGSTIRASAALDVREANDDVWVVGADAATVVAALRTQSCAARALEALPDVLEGARVIVALQALDPDAQRRLDRFCDDGGGVFLVGGRQGGALPAVDAPLAAAAPLIAQPQPAEDPHAAGGGDGPGEGGPGQATSPGEARPDQAAVPPPPPPQAATDTPIVGDTSGARGGAVETVEVARRSIALVLVIDRSGSMDEPVRGSATKMDFAKRSAYETAIQLEADDQLGIVAFGSRSYDVLELGPLPDERTLRAAIERLRATDSATLLADATERAETWLSKSTAPVRHAVLVTDGESLDLGDVTRAQAAARRMAGLGITVSLIQIASTKFGRAGEVARIAALGGGQFVRETDGGAIPRLVFAEVRRALGAAGRRPIDDPEAAPGAAPGSAGDLADAKRAAPKPDVATPQTGDRPDVAEPSTAPAEPAPERPPSGVPPDRPDTPPTRVDLRVVALDASPLLEPVPDGGFPALHGVATVTAQARAQVLLATADGVPVLAFAHRGLGRIGAWAADWTGAWSADWRAEPSFPARLATWVSAVQPGPVGATDVDRLGRERSLEPAAPTRGERARLGALVAGAALRSLDALQRPARQPADRTAGRAPDFALLALPVLLLLAFVEWRVQRR